MNPLNPRAAEISLLRELVATKDAEILYLRSQIAELQRMNVTLTNQHAARLLGYTSEVPPPDPRPFSEPTNPMAMRDMEAPAPEFSLAQLQKMTS